MRSSGIFLSPMPRQMSRTNCSIAGISSGRVLRSSRDNLSRPPGQTDRETPDTTRPRAPRRSRSRRAGNLPSDHDGGTGIAGVSLAENADAGAERIGGRWFQSVPPLSGGARACSLRDGATRTSSEELATVGRDACGEGRCRRLPDRRGPLVDGLAAAATTRRVTRRWRPPDSPSTD